MNWNFNHTFFIPLERDEDDIVLANKSVPRHVLSFLKEHTKPTDDEISVSVQCTGYHHNACIYGDPSDCYPEEYEDERYIEEIELPDGVILSRNPRGSEADILHFVWLEQHICDYIYKQDLEQ